MIRYASILVLAARLVRGETAAAPPKAPEAVEIVLYSDFQCPFCKQFSQPIRDLMAKGVDGIPAKVTFKNFPLSFHPDAQLAAQAAMAAKEQGKFWEMHDLLFANQSALKRDDLLDYAKKLGLDLNRFQKDLDSEPIKDIIKSDEAEGTKRGVSGTPTFYIDGKPYSGTQTFDEMVKLIRGEQGLKRALAELPDAVMSKGPEDAPVVLEFFADLESPVSRPAMEVLNEVMAQYPAKVRVQFRNFPLAFHPQAPLAHEAAMDAARLGHFWDFANYILGHQDSLREQDLIAYAGTLGLDENKFAETLQQKRYSGRVDADLADGAKRGVRGSPVVFVNAKRIDGVPSLKILTQYVEEELAKK
jgi:protein-disulfide isomerase